MKFYMGMCHGITCLKIKKKYSESCLVFALNAFFLKTNSRKTLDCLVKIRGLYCPS